MADDISQGSGRAAELSLPPAAHMVEVWSVGRHLLTRVALFGAMKFTTALTAEWPGPPVSVLHALDPTAPARVVDSVVDADGEPLAVWHSEIRDRAVAAFEAHFMRIAIAVAAADWGPVEREAGPTTEELRAAVEVEYARLVARKAAKNRGPARAR